jgi:hypothetical protein
MGLPAQGRTLALDTPLTRTADRDKWYFTADRTRYEQQIKSHLSQMLHRTGAPIHACSEYSSTPTTSSGRTQRAGAHETTHGMQHATYTCNIGMAAGGSLRPIMAQRTDRHGRAQDGLPPRPGRERGDHERRYLGAAWPGPARPAPPPGSSACAAPTRHRRHARAPALPARFARV